MVIKRKKMDLRSSERSKQQHCSLSDCGLYIVCTIKWHYGISELEQISHMFYESMPKVHTFLGKLTTRRFGIILWSFSKFEQLFYKVPNSPQRVPHIVMWMSISSFCRKCVWMASDLFHAWPGHRFISIMSAEQR